MICQRCLYRATTRARLGNSSLSTFPSQLQPLTTRPATYRLTHAFSRTLTTSTQSNPNSSTSTSTPELSHPLTPTLPPTASASASASASKTTPTSSVPAGTPLRGLNYLKSGSEPVALEDDAYPAWLWRCLDSAANKSGADGGDGGAESLESDLFSKSSKQRRRAGKKLRKLAAAHPEGLEPKVPVQAQSVDLWAGDGSVEGAVRAEGGRREVTRALRGTRRRGIKEANFLRGMR